MPRALADAHNEERERKLPLAGLLNQSLSYEPIRKKKSRRFPRFPIRILSEGFFRSPFGGHSARELLTRVSRLFGGGGVIDLRD